MSDKKCAPRPTEVVTVNTRAGNPWFDHPTLLLGSAPSGKLDRDPGVIRGMSVKATLWSAKMDHRIGIGLVRTRIFDGGA